MPEVDIKEIAADGYVKASSRSRLPLSWLQIFGAMLAACTAAVGGFRFIARSDAAQLVRDSDKYNSEHFVNRDDLKLMLVPQDERLKNIEEDIRAVRLLCEGRLAGGGK